MGRPRRQEARIEHVHFRLTSGEYAAIHAKAVEAGFRQVAAFCRATVLATTPYEDRPYPNGPTYAERARCQELKQWGVSLSQLTRHITLHPHHPLPSDLAPLLATLRAILARDLDYGA